MGVGCVYFQGGVRHVEAKVWIETTTSMCGSEQQVARVLVRGGGD